MAIPAGSEVLVGESGTEIKDYPAGTYVIDVVNLFSV